MCVSACVRAFSIVYLDVENFKKQISSNVATTVFFEINRLCFPWHQCT